MRCLRRCDESPSGSAAAVACPATSDRVLSLEACRRTRTRTWRLVARRQPQSSSATRFRRTEWRDGGKEGEILRRWERRRPCRRPILACLEVKKPHPVSPKNPERQGWGTRYLEIQFSDGCATSDVFGDFGGFGVAGVAEVASPLRISIEPC